MTPDLLKQLADLSRLSLTPEMLKEVLEHDKWKTRETHRHEKEMKALESGRVQSDSSDDLVFNSDTSAGQCEPVHVGLIAKSRVCTGALIRAKEIDNPDSLAVQIISFFISVSWCGQRMGRWPKAKDCKTTLTFPDDLNKMIEKYGKIKVIKAAELVKQIDENWDQRLIHDQLDALRLECDTLKTQCITNSPLFVEFHKHYGHIEPSMFGQSFEQHDRRFVETAIYLLRREFKNHPPAEFEHIEGWQQRWQQHLPHYLAKWRDDLKKMENRLWKAQKLWKESTF